MCLFAKQVSFMATEVRILHYPQKLERKGDVKAGVVLVANGMYLFHSYKYDSIARGYKVSSTFNCIE